jgi:undecaprenyl-diphosphatase
MSILHAVILGLIQGLTEFLPVSSSGHLVIFQGQLGMDEPRLAFDILLHTGTLGAVIICYRWEVLRLMKALLSFIAPGLVQVEARWRRFLALIIVSSVPTFILGYFIGERMKWVFASPLFAASMLLVTGVFLKFTGVKRVVGRSGKGVEKITVADALIVGAAQGAAVFPGISRSGATISTGLFLGFNREEAVRYSFLAAAPAMVAAQLWSMREGFEMAPGEWPAYISGAAVAFAVGYAALKTLIRITTRGRLSLFSYYCWGLGALVIIAFLMRG